MKNPYEDWMDRITAIVVLCFFGYFAMRIIVAWLSN